MANDLMTNTGIAAVAYEDALKGARDMQNSLLRQYGFVSADAAGNYTTENAQSAFDPRTLFRDAAPTQEQLNTMMSNFKIGSTGALSDIMRMGASAQSDVTASARQAGFGVDTGISGGLTQQRRELAASKAQQELQAGEMKFLTSEAGALAPIGGAYSDLQKARLMDVAQQNLSTAEMQTTPTFNFNLPSNEASVVSQAQVNKARNVVRGASRNVSRAAAQAASPFKSKGKGGKR